MSSFIKNWFGKRSTPIRSKRAKRNHVRPSILALEERSLMAVTAIGLSAGTLSITGSAGADKIYVREVDNLLVVDGGGAFIRAAVQRVEVIALGGDDIIRLDGGPNGPGTSFTGSAKIDLGSGNDTYFGGKSEDIVFGGTGDDTIAGRAGNDYLDGGDGNYKLYGDSGRDQLHGDTGNDDLFGGTSDDELCGGAGADLLFGSEGNDQLDGGTGDDTLTGSQGSDLLADDVGTNTDWNLFELDTRKSTHFAWFDMNVDDSSVRQAARFADSDCLLDRTEMMAIFDAAEDGNSVSTTEVTDLREIVDSAPEVMSTAVRNLSRKVACGDVANAHYQGADLGDLISGSSGTHLQKLVNKWFLGMDHPETAYVYKMASGELFQNGISQTDIDQGAVSDCYFVAALATAAHRSPNTIQNLFIDNGDNTYTVRFFKDDGTADYVTVDRYLPVNASDYFVYANNDSLMKYNNAATNCGSRSPKRPTPRSTNPLGSAKTEPTPIKASPSAGIRRFNKSAASRSPFSAWRSNKISLTPSTPGE
jgi:hypothetical protein